MLPGLSSLGRANSDKPEYCTLIFHAAKVQLFSQLKKKAPKKNVKVDCILLTTSPKWHF